MRPKERQPGDGRLRRMYTIDEATPRLGRLWHISELITDPRLGRTPGVYLFYSTYTGPPRYVGRSDTDLARRMQNRGFQYYRFKHCYSPAEAYRWECLYWHQHWPTIIYNSNHPARPAGLDTACPVCFR